MGWSAFGKALGSAAGGAAGSSLGGGISHQIYGNDVARAGHQLDYKYSLRKQEGMYHLARTHGLTAQEFYGSPAAGGNQQTGAGQVLGNLAAQGGQAAAAGYQASLNRKTALEQTAMQTTAQVKVAEIAAGQQQKGLDQIIEEYTNVTLPRAAKELQIKEQELNIALNQVQTTDREFVLKQTLLKMGVENTIQTALLAKHKVTITDPESVRNMTPEAYAAMMADLLAAGSHTRKEAEGFAKLFERILGKAKSDLPDNRREKEVLGRKPKYKNKGNPHKGEHIRLPRKGYKNFNQDFPAANRY